VRERVDDLLESLRRDGAAGRRRRWLARRGALILANCMPPCNECRNSEKVRRNFSAFSDQPAAHVVCSEGFKTGGFDMRGSYRSGDSLPRSPNGKILKRDPRAEHVRA